MLNEIKYKNMILYFISYCQNNFFGSTKLNKLLYYTDFCFYRDNKKTISGDIYRKLDFGPVGKNIQDILKQLENEGKIEINDSRINGEFDTIKFIAKENVNIDVFNEKEKELLKKVNDNFIHYSTKQIVNQTHAEAPWLYTKLYNDIDFKLAEDIDII